MGLALGTALRFNTKVTKELQLKVNRFSELIRTFVEVKKKLAVGDILPHIR